jgi:hypothetical protein
MITRKLSFEEQKLLTQEQAYAYFDWLMSRPIRTKVSEEEYLDGDYAKHGSMQATEWGQ